MSVNQGIREGFGVDTDCDHDTPNGAALWAVYRCMDARGLTALDVIAAFRSAAENASSMALGGVNEEDLFNGTTSDAMLYAAQKLKEVEDFIRGTVTE